MSDLLIGKALTVHRRAELLDAVPHVMEPETVFAASDSLVVRPARRVWPASTPRRRRPGPTGRKATGAGRPMQCARGESCPEGRDPRLRRRCGRAAPALRLSAGDVAAPNRPDTRPRNDRPAPGCAGSPPWGLSPPAGRPPPGCPTGGRVYRAVSGRMPPASLCGSRRAGLRAAGGLVVCPCRVPLPLHGNPFRIGTVYVHSANPIRAETVVRSLSRWSTAFAERSSPDE